MDTTTTSLGINWHVTRVRVPQLGQIVLTNTGDSGGAADMTTFSSRGLGREQWEGRGSGPHQGPQPGPPTGLGHLRIHWRWWQSLGGPRAPAWQWRLLLVALRDYHPHGAVPQQWCSGWSHSSGAGCLSPQQRCKTGISVDAVRAFPPDAGFGLRRADPFGGSDSILRKDSVTPSDAVQVAPQQRSS